MESNSVEYHLNQAVSHLILALKQTQSQLQLEATVEENAQKWSDFLTFLMGNVHTTTHDEIGEAGNDGAKY